MSSESKQKIPKSNVPENSLENDEVEKLVEQEKLERELVWCIQKLEMGISNPGSAKPDSKQIQDATRILKILRNPNSPLVKKRQAMRSAFGDYRKKMQQEQKKHMASMKKMKLKATDRDLQQKSTFYRKSTQQGCSSDMSNERDSTSCQIAAATSVVTIDKEFVFKTSGKNPEETFSFGFNVDTTKCEETAIPSQTHSFENMSLDEHDSSDQKSAFKNSSSGLTKEGNFFKIEPSNNDFRFNFQGS